MMSSNETELAPRVYRRAAPPRQLPISLEVAEHTLVEHVRACSHLPPRPPEGVETWMCPCERSLLVVCPECWKGLLLISFGGYCVHSQSMLRRHGQ